MFSSNRYADVGIQPGHRSPVLARKGMACTSQALASSAARDVLRDGGNAIDAAVTAAALLGVVEPYNTGVGGDCFMLIWEAEAQKLHGLNGSGRAPQRATIEEYGRRGLDDVPFQGILTVTVPGAVDAWSQALDRFGSRTLAQALEPAIAYAEEGFPVTEVVSHEWSLVTAFDLLRNDAAWRCYSIGGEAPRTGQVMRFPDMARTLRRIAEGGRDAFYEGELAERIVSFSEAHDGLIGAADLREQRSTWVEPISSDYRGTTLCELPPANQGITALLALNILENFDVPAAPLSADALHLRIEATKIAFADRARWVADPDFADLPIQALISKDYAQRRAAEICLDGALPGAVAGDFRDGLDTVYLTTADAEGNVVSLINSLYGPFGSGLVVDGTGIALQNRGRGFRLDPTHPNALAPRKRPFHTLCPAMLLRDGRPVVSFGVMGGDIQAQGHVQVVSNLVDLGFNVQEALDAPRFHYLETNRLALEADVDEGVRAELGRRGHEVLGPDAALGRGGFGGGQAIAVDPEEGTLWGGSDRRKDGIAAGL